MTSRSTNFRLASAAVAGVAVTATSLAALVLPGLAKADDPSVGASASPSAVRSVKAQPAASDAPDQSASKVSTPKPTTDSEPASSASPTSEDSATPEVETTNAPGSSASFGPAQEWTVLDPRFDKTTLNMLNGETFTMFADVLHSQPLEQDLSIKLDNLSNLDCEVVDETAESGSVAGLETFSAKCEITKSQSVISGSYQFVEADGDIIGEGIFGANPGELANPSSSATAEPGGVSDTTGNDDKAPETTGSTGPSSETTGDDDADDAAKAQIEIAKARFTPDTFPVVTGQEFRVDKDVTISEAPLHSELTMSIDRQQNVTCDPESASIDEGAEGTQTLTFNCTITGVDRAPGAWYSISLADGTVLISDAYFGLSEGGQFDEGGDDDGDAASGSQNSGADTSTRSTSGGLANTGGPLLGFLAAGSVLTALGTQLVRRRGA
ncbi:hypothetical protein ACF3NT_11740 [Naumannella halotolerans]|uniref:Gram-positive cocci surface proteins LPxTG domain-containing protein n=1 Tax=Naumannella halotolerans TaxID=993414 RepID=A0A4R7J2E6_9ACTN|nr:hypothetical protein [Naumannella halotolerans]TDT31254.1 hypothetical protein CLV29_2669 [Naumannella halotolerans]